MIPLPLSKLAKMMGATVVSPTGDVEVAGVSTDSRTIRDGELFFALTGPRFDGHDHLEEAMDRGGCAVVIERAKADGTSAGRLPALLVHCVPTALARLAHCHRRMVGAKVIAVTGSNGKTTTKNMITAVLSERGSVCAAPKSFNNHIGVPLTLLACTHTDDFVVVEVGTSAPGEIACLARIAAPDAAVVTSIGCAHLEGLGTLEAIAAEKLSIFDHVEPGGLATGSAEAVPQLLRRKRRELNWQRYGPPPDADVSIQPLSADLESTTAIVDDRHVIKLSVPGIHNVFNAAAAYTVGRHFNVPVPRVLDALRRFEMPDLRLKVHTVGTIRVINDSYNANPSSMSAALDVLAQANGGRRVFVAGDMAELGDASVELHRRVGEKAAQAGCAVVITIGALAAHIGKTAQRKSPSVTWRAIDDIDGATREIPELLRANDTVLIKGSRSAGLDVLLPGLQSRSIAPAAPA